MEQGCRGVETPSDYSHGVKVNDTTDTRRRRVVLVSIERPENYRILVLTKYFWNLFLNLSLLLNYIKTNVIYKKNNVTWKKIFHIKSDSYTLCHKIYYILQIVYIIHILHYRLLSISQGLCKRCYNPMMAYIIVSFCKTHVSICLIYRTLSDIKCSVTAEHCKLHKREIQRCKWITTKVRWRPGVVGAK